MKSKDAKHTFEITFQRNTNDILSTQIYIAAMFQKIRGQTDKYTSTAAL